MTCIEIIDNTIETIRKSGFENITVEAGGENIAFEKEYNDLKERSGIVFSQGVIELYKKYSSLLIEWHDPKSRKYGSFDMIPLKYISEHNSDLKEMAEDAAEYAHSESKKRNLYKLEMLEYMYPVFDFKTGDKLCIDSRTGHIVLFDHSVYELYDDDKNGLVLAKDFESLIESWSGVLFCEQFWWENGTVDENGINSDNTYFSEFMNSLKEH